MTSCKSDFQGSWHNTSYYGHPRCKPRSEYVVEYRRLAAPQPPRVFLKRSQTPASSHLFSQHDNRQSQLNLALYFEENDTHHSDVVQLRVDKAWQGLIQGIGKKRTIETKNNRYERDLLTWTNNQDGDRYFSNSNRRFKNTIASKNSRSEPDLLKWKHGPNPDPWTMADYWTTTSNGPTLNTGRFSRPQHYTTSTSLDLTQNDVLTSSTTNHESFPALSAAEPAPLSSYAVDYRGEAVDASKLNQRLVTYRQAEVASESREPPTTVYRYTHCKPVLERANTSWALEGSCEPPCGEGGGGGGLSSTFPRMVKQRSMFAKDRVANCLTWLQPTPPAKPRLSSATQTMTAAAAETTGNSNDAVGSSATTETKLILI